MKIARTLAIALLSLLPTMAIAQTRLNNYQPGPRLIDGTQLNLMVAAVNGIQGNGGTVGKGYFSLNTSTTTTGPTPGTGTVIQAVGANSATARIEIDSFAGVPIFTARRANGTKAAPTAVLTTEQIGSYNFGGAVSSTAYYAPSVSLRAYATENWSVTAGGSKIVFSVTPNTTQTLTDAVIINQDSGLAITSASATTLAAGRLGSTTPAFLVDASTATSITGVKIKSAASAGGVAISAIGEASNGAMTIDAQGSGTLTLNGTATGNIVMGRAVTGVSTSNTGGFAALSGTAVPASAGALAAGAPITMFSGGNKIWITSDAPSFSATKGDLCINTGGSSTSTRLYINNGTTNWIAITTAS